MAIFEKTIQNKKFDQLLWKLEKRNSGQQLVGRAGSRK